MIIYAPNPIPDDPILPKVFLAGSIEGGAADRWQDRWATELESHYTVLNPRRPDWDDSWPMSKDFPPFREQVEWELKAQEHADTILMYFDPTTKSPISLLELGTFFPQAVVCPEGFWRKGNVDIFCEYYGIRMFPTLDDAVTHLKEIRDGFMV